MTVYIVLLLISLLSNVLEWLFRKRRPTVADYLWYAWLVSVLIGSVFDSIDFLRPYAILMYMLGMAIFIIYMKKRSETNG